MNKKQHNQRQHSLRKQIIAITLSGILLICLFLCFISYYVFNNYLKETMISTTLTSISNLRETVDSNINNVYRMSRYCQSSSDIADYIKSSPDPGSVLSVKVYDRLYEEYANNEVTTYMPRVAIISDDNFLQVLQTSFSTTTDLATAIPQLPFFEKLSTDSRYNFSTGIINDPFLRGLPQPVIPIIRPINYKYSSKAGGYLYMEISANLFLDAFNRYYIEEGSQLYLYMPGHLYQYSHEDNSLTELPYPESFKEVSSYVTGKNITVTEYKTPNGNRTIIGAPLDMNDCYIFQSISPAYLQEQRKAFILIIMIILLFILGIGLALNLALNKVIYKPLFLIRQKILRTTNGDFTRDESIEWNHELGEIGKGINDLSESVDKLLETRIKDEKEKQDLEYQMLQSQINPHFLYNTLNSIKMMASMQGATGISDMTTALASLLRSISKGTSLMVPISEELSLVQNYFTIQNYRYGGMIEFEIKVDDDSILDSLILKFTLQPLVENAIFHGLEPKGGLGKIIVHVYKDQNDNINIDVTDNGVGISPDKMDDILNSNNTGKAEFFKEIGISNVNKRLQYEFGQGFGLSIDSKENEYTTMKVCIKDKKDV